MGFFLKGRNELVASFWLSLTEKIGDPFGNLQY